jgi:hypothetical protein
MGIKYKKNGTSSIYKDNPGVTRARSYEMAAIDQSEYLELAKDSIYEAKQKITGFTTLAQKNALKKEKANEVYMLSLAKGLDPEASQPIFEEMWKANSTDMGHRYTDVHVNVPLELLTESQIIALPRDSFSDKEFASLSHTLQAHIEGSEVTLKGKTDLLFQEIGGDFEEMMGDQADYDASEAEDDLYGYLNTYYTTGGQVGGRDNARIMEWVENLSEADSRELDNVFETWQEGAGLEHIVILDHLGDALRNVEYWQGETVSWGGELDYNEGPTIYPIRRRMKVSMRYLQDVNRIQEEEGTATINAILIALRERLNSEFPDDEGQFGEVTSWEYLKSMALSGDHYLGLESSHAAHFTVKWEDLAEYLNDELGELARADESQFESDGEQEPEEDRILYTFEDGFDALRMSPEDLPKAGEELGFCLGDPASGYGHALKEGRSAFYAIRTPGGRVKLVIEINSTGEPWRVTSIHGKGNRLPGWGGQVNEGKVKWMEVQKVGKVLELLSIDPAGDGAGGWLGEAHKAMGKIGITELTQNPCPLCLALL